MLCYIILHSMGPNWGVELRHQIDCNYTWLYHIRFDSIIWFIISSFVILCIISYCIHYIISYYIILHYRGPNWGAEWRRRSGPSWGAESGNCCYYLCIGTIITIITIITGITSITILTNYWSEWSIGNYHYCLYN